jgi:mRNA interferase MazF
VPSPRWGEIWNVDFGVPLGHEQGKSRPALVVSSDWFNDSRAELLVVLPLSTTIRDLGMHYRVDPPEGGIDRPSDIMCEHVRSVSLVRFGSKRGEVTKGTMEEVLKRLKVLLLLGARA